MPPSCSGRRGGALRVLVVTALATALLLASGAAAGAGSWRFTDPGGDVVRVDPEGRQVRALPGRAAGDVQRVAVGHARGRLVVRLTLRAGLPSSYWQVSEQVVTGRARFALNVYRGHGWGAVSLYRYRGVQDVRAVRCAGLRVSHGVRTVVLSLPTRCLGEPRSVRVRALVATGDEDGLDVADDALRGGWREGGTRLSPRIPRG